MHESRLKTEQWIARQIAAFALLTLLAIVQYSIAPTAWLFRIDWVLVAVVCGTLRWGMDVGIRWTIYGGLALDWLGTLPVGSHLLALLLCISLIAVLAEPFDREQPVLIYAMLLGTALLYNSALLIIMRVTGSAFPLHQYLLAVLLPTAIIDALIAIPVTAMVRYLRPARDQALDM